MAKRNHKKKKNTKQQIEFSAIGSWAGYIYQGLCAAIESLQLLNNNKDNYTLVLDAYEDFAILDQNGKIYSFHQCKDIKSKSSYKNTFSLMRKVKKYYSSKIRPDTKLYFHCNKAITPKPRDIELYKFPNGEDKCSPGNIYNNLILVVNNYLSSHSITTISAPKASAIISEKIQCKILEVQQKFFEEKRKPLKVIAETESKIKLQEIKNILHSSAILLDSDNFPVYTKQKFLDHLTKILDDDTILNSLDIIKERKIKKILKTIGKISPKNWVDCLYRITPDLSTHTGSLMDNITSCISDNRAETLYSIVQEIDDQKLEPNLYLKNKETTSLSTIKATNDSELQRRCLNIYKCFLSSNNSFKVRWYLASTTKIVDNIVNELSHNIININSSSPQKPTINNSQYPGLLTPEAFNNGKY
ncbi:hypothetical protein IKQ19_11270 [Candidatus Saccharibacteria bacterium]|nr:hypothetical protein [Candidatus Saccharibacteria bacterium]